ncbi:MAG: NTP transferase domain-containing protein, partial [Muribaculaceae bacterium]|nr:NTP transferase domain-containing protein [Muribaculaceae bacterium]
MKAFILAAGLGTRLRPWTLEHPKALVPVGGVPMLERVILRMRDQGFDDITVNVHHFADQIVDFLNARDFGVAVHISDERERLLDTGGAILHASRFLAADPAPFLVHNVDILSDAPHASLMEK